MIIVSQATVSAIILCTLSITVLWMIWIEYLERNIKSKAQTTMSTLFEQKYFIVKSPNNNVNAF